MRRVALLPVLAAVLCLGPTPCGLASPDASPTPTPATTTPHRASETVKTELKAVIDGQLAAFRANDYPKAFTFASAMIQSMFAPEEFEKMVKTAYPIIAHSVSTEYGVMFDTGEDAVVNVRVQNAGKQSVEYQYLLKKEGDGWKINGVSEVKAEGLSV